MNLRTILMMFLLLVASDACDPFGSSEGSTGPGILCAPGEEISCKCAVGPGWGFSLCDANATTLGVCVGCPSDGTGGGSSETTTSTSTGSGICVPNPIHALCNSATCGTVDDGCGGTIECGTCSEAEVCYQGACCTKRTCADGFRKCGLESDGCGGVLSCDTVCGDGMWMSCGLSGDCECEDAYDEPGFDAAAMACVKYGTTHPVPRYCGWPPAGWASSDPPIKSDFPRDCYWYGLTVPGLPTNLDGVLWCCQH